MTVSNSTAFNLGQASGTYYALFDFYAVGNKLSPSGKKFRTYAGFYYYLITGSQDRRLLQAETVEELEALAKQHNWIYNDELEEILYNCVLFNLAYKPMWRLRLPKGTPVVWEEPDRSLKAVERRWLSVVRRVVES